MSYREHGALKVATELSEFAETRLLPGTGITSDAFWAGLTQLLQDFAGENRRLLEVRSTLQAKLDSWADQNKGKPFDLAAYQAFLTEIGYLQPDGGPFTVGTEHVDPEISEIAGPQLVVPITNARYALNAANARWRSLYDALYGTDALPGTPQGSGYDQARGAQAVAWAAGFLDRAVPLAAGSHANVTAYRRQGTTFGGRD